MVTDRHERDRLLHVKEVALRLGVSRGTAYRKIQEGQIPAVRLGGGTSALRVRESELDAWLNGDVYSSPEKEN